MPRSRGPIVQAKRGKTVGGTRANSQSQSSRTSSTTAWLTPAEMAFFKKEVARGVAPDKVNFDKMPR